MLTVWNTLAGVAYRVPGTLYRTVPGTTYKYVVPGIW